MRGSAGAGAAAACPLGILLVGLSSRAEEPGKESRAVKEARTYAHPYFWAAFVLIGDPD
jgi:CHAT domain-containing protein